MAGGIKVALLTTAAGLVIAVPVNIGYNFFVTRIDTLIVDMETGAQRILNLAWDLEKEGRFGFFRARRPRQARAHERPRPLRRPRRRTSPEPSNRGRNLEDAASVPLITHEVEHKWQF